MVFSIKVMTEYNDPNATFKIYTWVKNTAQLLLGNNNDKVLANNIITRKFKEIPWAFYRFKKI